MKNALFGLNTDIQNLIRVNHNVLVVSLITSVYDSCVRNKPKFRHLITAEKKKIKLRSPISAGSPHKASFDFRKLRINCMSTFAIVLWMFNGMHLHSLGKDQSEYSAKHLLLFFTEEKSYGFGTVFYSKITHNAIHTFIHIQFFTI